MLLAPLLLLAAIQASDDYAYVVRVGLSYGQCVYMTGDALQTAAQFRRSLSENFDRRRGLVIYHGADVPGSCVDRARRIAQRVGFRSVRAAVELGPVERGPP